MAVTRSRPGAGKKPLPAFASALTFTVAASNAGACPSSGRGKHTSAINSLTGVKYSRSGEKLPRGRGHFAWQECPRQVGQLALRGLQTRIIQMHPIHDLVVVVARSLLLRVAEGVGIAAFEVD